MCACAWAESESNCPVLGILYKSKRALYKSKRALLLHYKRDQSYYPYVREQKVSPTVLYYVSFTSVLGLFWNPTPKRRVTVDRVLSVCGRVCGCVCMSMCVRVCPCVTVCQIPRDCVQSHTYACVSSWSSSWSSSRMPTHEADLDAMAVSGLGFRFRG